MIQPKILILQTAFSGDVILTLPLLQVLKKKLENSEIDFLLIPQTKNLLENNPYVNEVIVYDKRKRDTTEFMSLANKLRNKNYEYIISPHRSFRSALLTGYASAEKSIGFDVSSFSFMYKEKVKYISGIHEIQRNLKLLEPLGIYEKEIVKPELFPGEEAKSKVREFLKANSISDNDSFITLAPGSVWFTKTFPRNKFVALLNLDELRNQKVLLIGGDADYETSEYIMKNSENKNIVNAAGKFSLLESSELIRMSKVLITNDSAPMHLAGAVGTRVISIFGATVPQFGFYPIGKSDVVIETAGLSCRPCAIHGGKKCPIGTFDCMIKIDGRTIAEKL